MRYGERGVKLTWRDVKSWAEQNGVTDDALVCSKASTGYRTASDVDFWPADDGEPARFVIIFRGQADLPSRVTR